MVGTAGIREMHEPSLSTLACEPVNLEMREMSPSRLVMVIYSGQNSATDRGFLLMVKLKPSVCLMISLPLCIYHNINININRRIITIRSGMQTYVSRLLMC